MSVKDRGQTVKQNKLRYECPQRHDPNNCDSPACPHCSKHHNSMLCYKREKEWKQTKKSTELRHPWKWAPGCDNPADLASRGIPPSELNANTLWWNGPPWLSEAISQLNSFNYQKAIKWKTVKLNL